MSSSLHEIKKAEHKQQKEILKAARLAFTNEKDLIKRKLAKVKFLTLLYEYKNKDKKLKLSEKMINDDEQVLISNIDKKETTPVVDTAILAKKNKELAENINIEIILKKKIIETIINKINNNEPVGVIIGTLMEKIDTSTELTSDELKLTTSLEI